MKPSVNTGSVWQGQKLFHHLQAIILCASLCFSCLLWCWIQLLWSHKCNKSRKYSHHEHTQRQTGPDNEVYPQKVSVSCTHTDPGPSFWVFWGDSLWDWLFQASWNRDSHTHMGWPCSFVNSGAFCSRQCVCALCVVCVCSCSSVSEKWGSITH